MPSPPPWEERDDHRKDRRMTPKDVLAEWLADHRMTPSHADGIIEALNSAGLFIGPAVATEDMIDAARGYSQPFTVWDLMRAAWQRDGT